MILRGFFFVTTVRCRKADLLGCFCLGFPSLGRSVNAAPAAIRAWPVARSQSFSSLIGAMMQRLSGGIEPAFPAEKWGLR
jgi:hypothetical protein